MVFSKKDFSENSMHKCSCLFIRVKMGLFHLMHKMHFCVNKWSNFVPIGRIFFLKNVFSLNNFY